MDLILNKILNCTTPCFAICATVCATIALTSGCSNSTDNGLGGIPTRINTLCTVDQDASKELGTAETPFTCRGMLSNINSAAIAVTRPSDDEPFEIFHIDSKASIVAQATTQHLKKPHLVETTKGFLLTSLKGERLIVTHHAMDLTERQLELTQSADKTFLSVEVASFPPKAPAEVVLIAAATETEVNLWRLDVGEDTLTSAAPLKYAETEYCTELALGAGEDGAWSLKLRCEEMLPESPQLNEGVATVSAFDEEGDDVPEYADISLTLDAELRCVEATSAAAEVSAPAPQAGYALKRFMDDQLPRPQGFRVRILGAIPLDEDKVMTLACQGDTSSPATLFTATLTCKDRP